MTAETLAIALACALLAGAALGVYTTIRVQRHFEERLQQRIAELRRAAPLAKKSEPTEDNSGLAAKLENGELRGDALRQLFIDGKARIKRA